MASNFNDEVLHRLAMIEGRLERAAHDRDKLQIAIAWFKAHSEPWAFEGDPENFSQECEQMLKKLLA